MSLTPNDGAWRPDGLPAWTRADLVIAGLLTVVAAAIRLPALGAAGLAVDEYYFWQSVSFLLDHGVPRFPDGGYYQRGLLLQYLVAVPMALFGRTEFAARLLPALAGVATVPATYLLARKVLERPWAIAATAMLVLSSWHVEMSRFARFYTPFQLLFVVFVACVASGWLDGWTRTKRITVATLLIVSPLVYEGAVLLCVVLAVLLLLQDRPWGSAGRRIVAAILALGAWNYLISGVSLRFLGDGGESAAEGASAAARGASLRTPVVVPEFPLVARVLESPLLAVTWVAVAAVLGFVILLGWRRATGFWPRAVLAAACAALAVQQIGLAAVIVLVGSLARPDVRDAMRLPFWVGSALAAVYWAAVAVVTDPGLLGKPGRAFEVLIDYGAVRKQLIAPYAGAVPAWSLGLLALFAIAVIRELRNRRPAWQTAILVFTCASVAIVPVFTITFSSTRYTFFALPLVLIAAVTGARHAVRSVSARPAATIVGCLVLLSLFAGSEDFHPSRFRTPAAPEILYRTGPYEPLADHWYGREDYRSVAREVERRAGPDDLVILDCVTATAYLDRDPSIYVPSWQVRYHSVARHGGRTELWTGRPLLGAVEDVARATLDAGGGWLVASRNRRGWRSFRESPATELARLGISAVEVAAGEGGAVALFRLEPAPAPPAPRGRPLPMVCGPGDPEGFLFLRPDASGDLPPQDRIVRALAETGANGMYVIAVRTHGGDGGSHENPFVDPARPEGEVDPDVLDRWHGWLRDLEEAAVVTALFLYDDSTDPFRASGIGASGGSGRRPSAEVTDAERAFVEALVERFADLDRIVWVVAEEYDEAIPTSRASELARWIREVHPGEPWVGVHQRPDLGFDFADDPAVDVFLMQWGDADSTPDDLHRAVVDARRFARGRYQVLMSEVPYGGVGTDPDARRKVWAMAMAGAGVMVNGWDVISTPDARLRECGDLVRWFGDLVPSRLTPADDRAAGDARYALVGDGGAVLLYAPEGDGPLELRDTDPGRYVANWLHPPTGRTFESTVTVEDGEQAGWPRPEGFSGEVALRLTPVD